MTLFNYSQEFNSLNQLLQEDEVNPETGEIQNNDEAIKQLFDELELNLSEKLENSQRYIIDTLSQSDTLKKEATRLNQRAKVLANKAERVKELMKDAILATGEKKITTDLFNFSIRSSKSVHIDDLEELSREYVKMTRTANKAAIKKALSEGEEIPGCSMVENKSLNVR